MAHKPTNQQIENFLEEFRACSRPSVFIQPKFEYKNFLTSNELLEEDAEKIILEELNSNHYHGGPEKERDEKHEPGEIWKFKINKYNTDIYIKLKLFKNKIGILKGKCLSFHP